MPILINILYIFFALLAIVLITVVLLQEGKGGGFTDALGAAGQQTFGVKASGIHKFTAWVGVLFLASALGITILNGREGSSSVLGEGSVLEATPDAGAGAAGGGGSAGGGGGGGGGGTEDGK